MITALFIYDAKGDILISKLFKEGVKRNVSDVFRIQVINSNMKMGNSKDVRSPVLTLGSTSFIYIRSNQLWITAVTRSNQDCSTILEFLYKFEQLMKATFSMQLTDEVIVNNFFSIYQLLDEVVQFGYPMNLEQGYLKSVLPSIPIGDGFKLNSSLSRRKSNGNSFMLNSNKSGERLHQALLNITWREQGIKYRRNEIFLNVEEQINVLTNEQSDILNASVDGKIIMKAHLSGMPECRFGLNDDGLMIGNLSNIGKNKINSTPTGHNDNVILEDCKFHQCVELNKFDTERIIQFIPPDGEFQLMSYNCLLNINLPFKVTPQVQQFGRKLQFKISIKSLFSSKLSATNVKIRIPTPLGVIKHHSSTSQGKVKFHPEDNLIVWKFNKFFGNSQHVLTEEVELTDDSIHQLINWPKPPIKLEFLIDMFSCSGLSVNYLRVHEKSNYRTVKWVKYVSQSGFYDIRY